MKIEIRATYPTTDGSMPEDVTVEIGDAADLTPSGELVAVIVGVLDRMFAAPKQRALTGADLNLGPRDRGGWVTPTAEQREQAHAAESENPCRRVVCGHGQMMHGRYDDQSKDLGMGNGRCLACGSTDQCRSYVGKETA